MEAMYMLELGILGLLILWAHLRIRSIPMRLRHKLVRSIHVYEHLQQQRSDLLSTMKPHESPAMVDTLTHLDRRINRLLHFIRPLSQRYQQVYSDPYKRRLLRLPSPPRFDP